MRLRLALACLTAALALPACFNPALSCRLVCSRDSDCPAGLTCQASKQYTGLCAQNGDICEARDAGPDLADATTEAVDVMATLATDARPEARPAPTQMCTKDGAHCIMLSEAVRSGLVLWLDPTNLPPPQQTVSVWPDQSGQGNDAMAEDPTLLPIAASNGIVLAHAGGAGLKVAADASLDFGIDDFFILVVASVTDNATSFFMKVDDPRAAAGQVWLRWVFSADLNVLTLQGIINSTTLTASQAIASGSPQLYVLRRANDTVELRTNGVSLGSAPIDNPSVTTNSVSDLYLGVLGGLGTVVDSMEAVVVVRGQLQDSDVSSLESYLTLFALP